MSVMDYEVFKHNSLLGVLDTETNEIHQIWGVPEITNYIKEHVRDLWIGYNSNNYDKVLAHAMLMENIQTDEQTCELSNAIIRSQDNNKPLFETLKKYGINDYYSSPLLIYDVMGDGSFFSLKQLEGYMGMSIVESVVPFDLDRPLTPEEKADVEKYNRADLYGTLERFKQRKSSFRTKMMLVKEFDLPTEYICKTNAKLTEAILLSRNKGVNTRLRKNFNLGDLPVHWDVPEIQTIYKFFLDVLEECRTHKWDTTKCDKTKLSMVIDILGVPHTYALGGVHGGIKNYMCRPEDKKKIIWVDVGLI